LYRGYSPECQSARRTAWREHKHVEVLHGAVKEVKLELAFSWYEVYEEKIREVYRPKGLLAFTTTVSSPPRLFQPLLYGVCEFFVAHEAF